MKLIKGVRKMFCMYVKSFETVAKCSFRISQYFPKRTNFTKQIFHENLNNETLPNIEIFHTHFAKLVNFPK